MLYDIKLVISYSYTSPAGGARTLLRMMPRSGPDQSLLIGRVFTDPAPGFRRDGADFFGNNTTEIAHDDRMEAIRFQFEGRVRREGPTSGLDLSCPLSQLPGEVTSTRSVAPDAPHHFLGASPRIPVDPDIVAFARGLVSPDMSTRAAVEAVCSAIYAHFDFDPSATDVTTSPIDAFRAGRGVCQDISHVAISALRALGIPAAYVSGFLCTKPPEGQERLEGADAMHAWVRVWCGAETGWIELDPTNNVAVANDHVTVAYGRDYSDVAPVKGSLRSEGDHATYHAVDMIPVEG